MHDDDLASAVAMRVGIFFSGPAVGGPARVADAVRALQRGLGNALFEIAHLARRAANFQFASLRHYGDACGIIAAVLQLAQAFDDDRHNFFGPDIADYSAHARRLLREFLAAQHASGLTKLT